MHYDLYMMYYEFATVYTNIKILNELRIANNEM